MFSTSTTATPDSVGFVAVINDFLSLERSVLVPATGAVFDYYQDTMAGVAADEDWDWSIDIPGPEQVYQVAPTSSRLLPPSPAIPGSGCRQLHSPLRRQGRAVVSHPCSNHSASWRTGMWPDPFRIGFAQPGEAGLVGGIGVRRHVCDEGSLSVRVGGVADRGSEERIRVMRWAT